jgi:hypothetical protein
LIEINCKCVDKVHAYTWHIKNSNYYCHITWHWHGGIKMILRPLKK